MRLLLVVSDFLRLNNELGVIGHEGLKLSRKAS